MIRLANIVRQALGSAVLVLLTNCHQHSLGTEIESHSDSLKTMNTRLYYPNDILAVLDNSIINNTKFIPIEFEDEYLELCKVRMHLYKSSANWAIVFERTSYNGNSNTLSIDLIYFTNYLNGVVNKNDGSNLHTMVRIDFDSELPNRFNFNGFISSSNYSICVNESDSYRRNVCISRQLCDSTYEIIGATKEEIMSHIDSVSEHLVTLDDWHHVPFNAFGGSVNGIKPSLNPFYQSLAAILVSGNANLLNLGGKPNCNWRNWSNN